LKRNAAYLSDLFSHAVGLPFKAYLTELRLEKAKELLVDPKYNVNEVAQAVGYAGADRFRLAFKQHTGLAPSRWREMMRPTR
jgi:two-component system response regulator YesN